MEPHSWETCITTCSRCCLLCKQSYFDGLDPLCVFPLHLCVCFSAEVNLKTRSSTRSVSLSDAVINIHTAVLRLSDDVIRSAAVLLLLERGESWGWVGTSCFHNIIIGFISYFNIICFLQDYYSISLKALSFTVKNQQDCITNVSFRL